MYTPFLGRVVVYFLSFFSSLLYQVDVILRHLFAFGGLLFEGVQDINNVFNRENCPVGIRIMIALDFKNTTAKPCEWAGSSGLFALLCLEQVSSDAACNFFGEIANCLLCVFEKSYRFHKANIWQYCHIVKGNDAIFSQFSPKMYACGRVGELPCRGVTRRKLGVNILPLPGHLALALNPRGFGVFVIQPPYSMPPPAL